MNKAVITLALGLAVFCCLFSFRSANAATDYWFDDLTGTAGVQPAGWRDETNNSGFNADIAFSYTSSWAAVTRTADDTWGKVLSGVLTLDPTQFPSLEIVVSGLSPGAKWKVGIQEEEGSYATIPLGGYQTGLGTFKFDYSTMAGWTVAGTHTFSVEIDVEGGSGSFVVVDSVRISTMPPEFWRENFEGSQNQQVLGWQISDPPTDFNARIYYSGHDGAYVEVTPSASQSFGKVLSPELSVNTSLHPLMELKVMSFDKSAAWKVRIQEMEGTTPRSWDLRDSTQRAGTFVINYAAITGWTSGIHRFKIEVDVEGVLNQRIELDSIRILNASILPTPVATPTPYAAEFDLDASPPQGWMYSSTNNPLPVSYTAGVRMYSLGGYAYLTFTSTYGSDLIGKAISTTITVDTDSYPELWFSVTDSYPFNCIYRVSLWTQNVGIFPIFSSAQNPTGLKKINYRELIRQEMPGWGGPQTLNVELLLEGEIDSYVRMDYIRFEPPAATPTITPTPVVDTLRPSANMFRPDQGPLTIQYMVHRTDTIRITVYNTAGTKVRTLVERNTSSQVSDTVEWDGRNEAGDWVGSGVYVIRIESKDLQNNTRFFKNVRMAVVR